MIEVLEELSHAWDAIGAPDALGPTDVSAARTRDCDISPASAATPRMSTMDGRATRVMSEADA